MQTPVSVSCYPRSSFTAATATFVIALSTAAPARAQNADAEALFNDANRLLTAGKTAEACDAFESSNRIEQRAGTLIRLGECRELNHQLASAWSAYKDALTRVRDPRKRDIARAKIAAIEPRLSYLTVLVADEARIDGLALTRNGIALDPGLWNRAIPIDGGSYTIGGRAPGHEEWNTSVTVPPEGGKLSVEVPKFKEIAKLIAPDPRPQGPSAQLAVAAHAPPPPTDRLTAPRKLAIGAAGVSIAALGAGIVLGLEARSKRSDAFALCADPAATCAEAARANALIQASHGRALAADVGFGIAAAAAVTAGVLWLTGNPERIDRIDRIDRAQLTAAPSVSAHQAGIVITGGF